MWWLSSEHDPRADVPGVETAADRVGGFGLFAGEDGEGFAAAVAKSREDIAADYEERHDDLFGH